MHVFTGKRIAEITESDLTGLVARAIPESLTLDYKQELHLSAGDKEKKEFLADVTAFANAEGGLIIVGIEEGRDPDGKRTGLPEAVNGFDVGNTDEFTKLIDALVRDGIDERLPLLESRFIPLANNKFALAIEIPMSPRAPHMITLGKERRFYRRTNGGNEPMTTAQIRDAVLRTDSITERVRSFLDHRRQTLKSENERSFWALHLIPLFGHGRQLDLANSSIIDRLRKVPLPYFGDKGGDFTHSLDGYKRSFGAGPRGRTYTLIFRDGAIECVDQFVLNGNEGAWGGPLRRLHEKLVDCFEGVFPLCREGLCPLPIVVALTLDNLTSQGVVIKDEHGFHEVTKNLPTGQITAGEQVLTQEAIDSNLLFKPMLDLIWQAAGFPRCPAYTQDGKHVGYKNGSNERLDIY